MVKPTAHDGLDECSSHSGLNFIIIYTHISIYRYVCLYISPSAGIGRQSDLKFRWHTAVNVQVVSWILIVIVLPIINYRGYSLTGKTSILHIVISGSTPDISRLNDNTYKPKKLNWLSGTLKMFRL